MEISCDEKYDFATVFSKHLDEKFTKEIVFEESNFNSFNVVYTFLKGQETSVGLTFLSLGVPTAFYTMKYLNSLTDTEISQKQINEAFCNALIQSAFFIIGQENVATKNNLTQALTNGDLHLPDFDVSEFSAEKFQADFFQLSLKPQVKK